MCSSFKTPGPQYQLRSVVGYNKHCLSKYRGPQYSFGLKLENGGKSSVPGPKYSPGKYTRYGKATPPAFSLYSRNKGFTPFNTPGPDVYKVERVPRMKEPRPPAFSIRSRQKGFSPFNTPGPNQYKLPSTLGPKIPDKVAKPAYSMSPRHMFKGSELSPGPAKYPAGKMDMIKPKAPAFGLRIKLGSCEKSIGPGPAAYSIKTGFRGGYTLHSRVCAMPYITPEDNMPCVNDV